MTNEKLSEPKLLGLSRPLIGAVIGIAIFLLYIFLFDLLASPIDEPTIFRVYFPWGLTFPAEVIARSFIFSTNLEYTSKLDIIFIIFIYTASSIPPALIGAQIISVNKSVRAKGLTWLIIYIVLTIIFGWCSWFGYNLG